MLTDLDHTRTRETLATQVDDYAELSDQYAASGDARRAALAIWASDVRAVQCVLWERGLVASDEPTERLQGVLQDVETALAGRGQAADVSARGIVEEARRALVTAFEESLHEELIAGFRSLDHLDDTAAPSAGGANLAVQVRLAGRTGEQLVSDLLLAAADCRAVARVMAEVGDVDEAHRQAAAADRAGFEAYLVLASAASGDATLATTELRWDLAAAKSGRSGSEWDDAPIGTVPWSVRAMRHAMCSVLVPAEEQALLSVFDDAAPVLAVG